MRRLTVDIETRPNLAHVWGLFDQNVGINQLIEPVTMLCFAAKWYDRKTVEFYSVFHDGVDVMRAEAHRLLNETDVVIHYNGRSFDIPHLNREFILGDFLPPAPYKQVDLLSIARKQFKFPSNKLAYVADALGVGTKMKNEGHELWIKCMAGDEAAWATMKKYNVQDVIVTEKLYDKLLPWITNLPSVGALTDTDDICRACGSSDLAREGFALTMQGKYQRFRCNACGTWSRSGKRVGSTNLTQITG